MLIRDERSIYVINSIKSIFASQEIPEKSFRTTEDNTLLTSLKNFPENINLSILCLLRNTLEEIQWPKEPSKH